MKVLILSSSDDVHAAAVHKHLIDMHAHVDFFRAEEFITQSKSLYTLGMDNDQCWLRRLDAPDLDLRSYSAIWHRRPGRLVAGQFPEPWIARMVEQESRSALDGMFLGLSCLWVNHPRNDQASLQKLWQLELASKLGMTIPQTIVTNQADLVREFYADCKGSVIYKMIGEASNFNIPAHEMPRGVSTLPLREVDLPFLEQVIHAPHLFQRMIPKSSELRVTIVGETIFSIEIHSQKGAGKIDWRNDYSVPMQPYDLPPSLSEKCLGLMTELGLNYGAIDFVLAENGEYVFLEINCAGQYMWIEQRCEMRISLELARLLAGVAPPLVSRA